MFLNIDESSREIDRRVWVGDGVGRGTSEAGAGVAAGTG
jgi:hypothetical protein